MGFFRRLFGGGSEPAGGSSDVSGSLLKPEEMERIGTEDDLLRNYEAQLERNYRAMEAEQRGDLQTAIHLYEESVAEEFVGAHPYERLSRIYDLQRRPNDARRVTEAFIRLAKSGRLPKGSQRSANIRLPDFEARIAKVGDHPR